MNHNKVLKTKTWRQSRSQEKPSNGWPNCATTIPHRPPQVISWSPPKQTGATGGGSGGASGEATRMVWIDDGSTERFNVRILRSNVLLQTSPGQAYQMVQPQRIRRQRRPTTLLRLWRDVQIETGPGPTWPRPRHAQAFPVPLRPSVQALQTLTEAPATPAQHCRQKRWPIDHIRRRRCARSWRRYSR